jgi:hypothetical protein
MILIQLHITYINNFAPFFLKIQLDFKKAREKTLTFRLALESTQEEDKGTQKGLGKRHDRRQARGAPP